MAIYQNFYDIEVRANNALIDILPSEFSFILSDSIHSLYNSASFTLNDYSGLIQESLATVENYPVTVRYGDKNNYFVGKYVINRDSLEKANTPGILSGPVKVDLLPAWFGKQQVWSKAYANQVSNVIKQVVSREAFNAIDIPDVSGGYSTWYQPMVTDAYFVDNILLPNVQADNSNNTPFFAYITSDYKFHLRSFNSLFTPLGGKPVLAYRPQTQNVSSQDNISQLKRWRAGLVNHWKDKNRFIYSISEVDGSLTVTQDNIKSYPPTSTGKVPIYGTNNIPTSYFDIGYARNSTNGAVGYRQAKTGRKINSMKSSLFMEEYEILTPLNPTIFSGQIVEVDIYMLTKDSSFNEFSRTFKGDFLVETASHVWDGKRQTGYSKFIVGRKYTEVPTSYYLGSQLV